MASPIINFLSITGRKISAGYQNLPIGSKVVLMNQVSGQAVPNVSAEIKIAGARLLIELPPGVPAGGYYLKAEDKNGGYLAESVKFLVN